MTKAKSLTAPAGEGFSLIPHSRLLALYAAMTACHRLAQESRAQSPRPRVPATAHSIHGHEASAVGAVSCLLAHDTIAPALWPEPALQLINPEVATVPTIAAAVRAALAESDKKKVTLLFSSTRRGAHPAWTNAMQQAAKLKLPILFLSLHRESTADTSRWIEDSPHRLDGVSLPSIMVDGHDAVAVYRVATESITHARKGNGPTLIDCRLAATGNPLENMRNYLILKGLNPLAK